MLVSEFCPFLVQGVVLTCDNTGDKSNLECLKSRVDGTEVYFQCQDFHVSPEGGKLGGKLICSKDGRWKRFSFYEEFFCIPGTLQN